MDDVELIEIARQAILLTLKIGTPVMIVGLLVGVVIALFQALTQIQEMTLTFVPKIIAIFFAIFLWMPAMMGMLSEFMMVIADKIIGIG